MDNLFVKKEFISHSGKKLDFKIECDALTYKDIETLAYIISKRFIFSEVFGVPNGGIRIANALKKYRSEDNPYLIVDDVLTTGKSMEDYRRLIMRDTIGVVLFSRGKCPSWITPIFKMIT